MLSPEYLDECSNQLINLYSELENRIIADIVRRLLKTGNITETAKWEILKAQELGLLYDDVLSLIASQTDATSNHVKALFEDAGVETVNIDNEKYRKMGKTPIDIRQSDSMKQVLEAGYQKTLGNLQNLTMTTAITSQTTFINASNSAYMMVTSGAFSYQDAIRTAIKEMAQKGVSVLTDTIKYEGTNKKGQHYTHEDKIDVAVRRNVLTGVGQTCKQVSLTNAKENGFDLMEINAHSGARPSHAKWQGKRVSLSGRKGYLSLHDIGYGSAEGFGGCNCRHDWYPVDENDVPMYTNDQLKDFDAKNIEYNGKKYTQYEATQIQRRKEREIRDLKREAVAYDTAIKETDDEELKSKLKDDFTKTSNKLKDKEKALADFTKETGIKRDKFREQVQGFNRSVSSKSTWANKKSRNDLTSAQNSGNMNNKDIPLNLKETVQNLKDNINIKISSRTIKDYHFGDGTSNKSNNYIRNATVYNYSNNISFVYPKPYNSEMQPINLERAVKIFNDVPKSLLKFVEKIEFVDYRNPQDTYWEKTYHIKGFVSFATGGNKEICFWGTGTKTDDTTILETYIHEIGHNFDNEIKMSSNNEWQQAINKDFALNGRKSPTSYGTSSNAEDFAESLAYYFVHAEDFKEQFPNRAKLIRRILNE